MPTPSVINWQISRRSALNQ